MAELRQAENSVNVEGILSEIDLNYISYKKNGVDTEAIGGKITIRVDQDNTSLEVPVHMFASKYKNDGKPNPAYDNINKIKTDYVSIAAAGGINGADRIRVSNGKITMNEFYGQNGNLVSQPRIQASFVTKVKPTECEPEATFSAELMVASMVEEMDKEGTPTGRLLIKGIVPQYGGKVDVVPFVAETPNVIDAITNYWNINDSVKAIGRLNFTYKTETYEESAGFGDSITKTRTISISDLVIIGGSETPLEEPAAFDINAVQAALNERKATLEAKKAKDMSGTRGRQAPAATTSKAGLDLGF